MNSCNKTKLSVIIFLVVIILAVRFLGVFWGVKTYSNLDFIHYHPDEFRLAVIADEFLTKTTNENVSYFKGFPFQMACVSLLLNISNGVDKIGLILSGRVLSVLYGILTIMLIYFLGKELFQNRLLALIAGAFLFLSGLHVTQSHYAVVDACSTFWIYATILFSLLSVRKQKNIYIIISMICCGISFATKMAWISLIPILYILIKQKRRFYYYPITLFFIFIVFIIANGASYTFTNFILTLREIFYDNIIVILNHNIFLNPIIYFISLIPGLGLPIFLLALYGIFRFLNKKIDFRDIVKNDVFYIVILPLMCYTISICFCGTSFSRHLLPIIPFLTIMSAFGLMEVRKLKTVSSRKTKFRNIVLLIFVYQLVYVVSTEYYFMFDTRETAYRWVENNIPEGKKITVTPYVRMPLLGKKYNVSDNFDSRFLILHEAYFYRYIRSELNPFKQYPDWDEIYHGDFNHFIAIQKLFKGQLNYKLLKKFEVKCYMPEMYFYKKFLGTYPLFIGDTLIYGQVE